MRKTLLRTILGITALALFGAASAYALKIEIGETLVSATIDVAPRELPAKGGAPVEVNSVTRIGTNDGSAPESSASSASCSTSTARSTPRACRSAPRRSWRGPRPRPRASAVPEAIVGEGSGRAEVRLPGKAPTEISSPLTLFNAPPVGGMPSLIIHAYETVPAPQTVLVPVAIERIDHGRYGFQISIQVPEIAGGFGAATLAKATIGKTWKRGGKTVGYLSAYCAGGRLQVNGKITMADGSFFPGTLTSPCHVGG